CVDEGAQDAPHLVSVVASLEWTQEAEVHHSADVTVHAIPEAGLVGRGGQEKAYQVEDVRPRGGEGRLTPHCRVLRELLAQERQRQAQREAVLAPRDEARQLRLAFHMRLLAQEGVALRLVQHQLETDDADVIAHPCLMREEALPEGGGVFALQDALHEGHEHVRQVAGTCSRCGVVHGAAPARVSTKTARAKITSGTVACRRRPSASVHTIDSRRCSSMMAGGGAG